VPVIPITYGYSTISLLGPHFENFHWLSAVLFASSSVGKDVSCYAYNVSYQVAILLHALWSEKMQKARNNSMLKTNEAYRQGSFQTSAPPEKSMGTREKSCESLMIGRPCLDSNTQACFKEPPKLLQTFLLDLNQRLESIAD
jgi:hypothetical protein